MIEKLKKIGNEVYQEVMVDNKSIKQKVERMIDKKNIAANFNYILSVLDKITKKKEIRVESFQEACERFALDDSKLKVIYQGLSKQFWYSLSLSIFLFIGSVAFLLLRSHWLTSLSLLTFSILAFSISITTTFRLSQIYNKNLFSFKDWFSRGEFFPKNLP